MSDNLERSRKLLQQVDLDWSPETVRATKAAIDRRRSKHPRRLRLAIATAPLLLGAVAAAWVLVPRATATRPPIADGQNIRFEDGSVVELLGPASSVRPREVTAQRTTLELMAGTARFDVAHVPFRTFGVQVGQVGIEVLGTRFTLSRFDTDGGTRAGVEVERGRVRVTWPDGAGGTAVSVLLAGSSGVFPPTVALGPVVVPTVADPAATSRATPEEAPALGPARASGTWRKLARAGKWGEAYHALDAEGGKSAVRDDPEDLLLAADVARESRHPENALAPLGRLLKRHAQDERAPSAAFMLGRVLLDDLARPREAAAAFARAKAAAPHGVLAEDALAREVEAWARSGDKSRTQEAARRYQAEYPGGRRLVWVRKLAELP